MNFQNAASARCAQQQFTTGALTKFLTDSSAQIGAFITFAVAQKVTPGRSVDVEIALSVLIQSMCTQLRVDPRVFGRAYSPFVNSALLHLASDPKQWTFLLNDDEEVRTQLFGENEGSGLRRRRIQELLGIQERPTGRYLLLRPGQTWSVSDHVCEKIGVGEEPALIMLDATAIANTLSRSCSGPFFTWTP